MIKEADFKKVVEEYVIPFKNKYETEYGNATSSVKNTIPGDLPSCDLKEIDRIIRNHKNTGIQLEMDR